MTEEKQTAKCISGLKYPIQECVILYDVFSINKAHNKVMKIERLQSRASPFKSVAEKTSSNTRTQQSSTLGDRPPDQKATDTATTSLVMTAIRTKKRQGESIRHSRCCKCYGMVNQNTSPISVQKEGKSTWWTMKMKTRWKLRLSHKILTSPKSMES